jgi:hypothetical protein
MAAGYTNDTSRAWKLLKGGALFGYWFLKTRFGHRRNDELTATQHLRQQLQSVQKRQSSER